MLSGKSGQYLILLMLSHLYDNPQRLNDVIRMFSRRGCDVVHAGLVSYPAGSSMVVRAIKRAV